MCKHSPVQSLTTTELLNKLGRWIPVIPRSPAENRRSCQSRDTRNHTKCSSVSQPACKPHLPGTIARGSTGSYWLFSVAARQLVMPKHGSGTCTTRAILESLALDLWSSRWIAKISARARRLSRPKSCWTESGMARTSLMLHGVAYCKHFAWSPKINPLAGSRNHNRMQLLRGRPCWQWR